MRTITLVYERHHYLYRWLKPMLAARKEFKKLGYKIEYQSIVDYFPIFRGGFQKKLEHASIKSACRGRHDIVMMAFHHSTSDFCMKVSVEERVEILKKIKAHCNTLVWLDTADSTGTCMFDVMPYVDLYFKKQVLKNTDDYCREVYGTRTFCEYYHDILKIEDDTITKRYYPHTEKQYLSKLRVAWNVGIGDLYAVKPIQLIIHPFSVTKPDFLSPDSKRSLDVQYRGSGYSPIAGYPRSRSKELMMELMKESDIKISDITKRIPKEEFIKEGQNSRCILSPFGWGEICGRDFEAFVYGGCMIKQDMSHCITYPNAYQSGVTYVPLKWDFSDFKEKLSKAASPEYKEFAKRAQEYYKHFFTPEGRMDFAKHIISELEK
ncbi:hypothetical protein [Bacteroides thetaiotaomicron]|uniref:hypothetical protein n=2 Tax=Bacteroides thetaiotaomicron TaxID=818 RepID=UPI00232DC107|nr:hypothetical protein [Bacteroides thetaiotaomicron]MDC2164060.1 hypothetical protein [Bacteroides thetaiotaomicron]